MATETIDLGTVNLIEIPYQIGGEAYTLQEATGKVAAEYRNAIFECTQFKDGQPAKITGLAEVELLLVSRCLYDSTGKPVPAEKIEKWPSRVIKTLFEKAKEISGLDEEESEEVVKND